MAFKPYPKKGLPPKKKRKPLKRTPLKRGRKKTGMLDLFADILQQRGPYCELTGKKLPKPGPKEDHSLPISIWCFSHIHSRGARPDMADDPENVMLKLPALHEKWERGDRSDPIFKKCHERWECLNKKYATVKVVRC